MRKGQQKDIPFDRLMRGLIRVSKEELEAEERKHAKTKRAHPKKPKPKN